MHWSYEYIGQPYVWGESDCGHLCARVARDVFGRDIRQDVDRARAHSALGRVRQIGDVIDQYCDRVEVPQEGDVVQLMCRARPSHVGVYCEIDGEAYVLHAMSNAGQVVLHRLRDLGRVCLTVEGFYKWK